ncbi:MAG: glutathione peroxidase [Planctomycetaceae bacterium]
MSRPSLSTLLALLILVIGAVQASADSPLSGTVKKIDGSEVDLAKYKGKVVMIVNVASRCGATPQYAGLQKLYDTYKDKGFVILGFPANEFGAQEPGTDAEISKFCTSNYNVTFDMFSKIVVKGDGQAPLYKALTTQADPAGDVKWNFEKFLIGKDGQVAARFMTRTTPEDPQVVKAIEAALAK